MLRWTLCSLVFASLVPTAHAFEFLSAEIVPGTSLLYRNVGFSAIREAEYFPTEPHDQTYLVDLDLERNGRGVDPFEPFEAIDGRVTIELPSPWSFTSGPGRISSLSSQIVFETYRVRFRGEPIAYLPIPPGSQAPPAPLEIALDVVGMWSLGDVVTPFSATFVGEPIGNGQTLDDGIRLSGLLFAPLPAVWVDGFLYEAEVSATATIILTPEPGTAALLGFGLIGLAARGHRRQAENVQSRLRQMR